MMSKVVEEEVGVTEDRVKLPRQLNEIDNFKCPPSLGHLLQYPMALTNAKRKLEPEDIHAIDINDKSRKRHHSDHALSSSISHQAAKGPGNRHAHRVKKATEPTQAFDKTFDSAVDEVPATSILKGGTKNKGAQEQSEFSSLNDGDILIADPTDVAIDAASKVVVPVPSIPPLEAALGDERGSQDEAEEENEEEGEDGNDSEDNDEDDPTSPPSSEISTESLSSASLNSDTSTHPNTDRKKSTVKSDNPTAFASSMALILDSKLTKTQRTNPILARSTTAKEADSTLQNQKLEKKAKAEMKREKENLRGADPQLVEGEAILANQGQEKELRKMAQRGVIKMFNAFNSARQRTMEAQAMRGSRAKKEEKATEMSKEGWLEYVGQGGKGKV